MQYHVAPYVTPTAKHPLLNNVSYQFIENGSVENFFFFQHRVSWVMAWKE